MFRGSFGVSRGHQAIKLEEKIRRNNPAATDLIALKKH
jgi:hypothetical protein